MWESSEKIWKADAPDAQPSWSWKAAGLGSSMLYQWQSQDSLGFVDPRLKTPWYGLLGSRALIMQFSHFWIACYDLPEGNVIDKPRRIQILVAWRQTQVTNHRYESFKPKDCITSTEKGACDAGQKMVAWRPPISNRGQSEVYSTKTYRYARLLHAGVVVIRDLKIRDRVKLPCGGYVTSERAQQRQPILYNVKCRQFFAQKKKTWKYEGQRIHVRCVQPEG